MKPTQLEALRGRGFGKEGEILLQKSMDSPSLCSHFLNAIFPLVQFVLP